MTFYIFHFKGDVFDANTSQPIENATLTIQGNTKTVRTTQNGEFWRLLTPGYYNISASATGYNQSPWIQVLVSENEAIYQQIELERTPLGIESSTGSTDSTIGSSESTPGSTEATTRSTDSTTGITESTTGNTESTIGITVSTPGITESPTEGTESTTGITESDKGTSESSTGSTESNTVNNESSTGSTESIQEPILEVVD